MSNREQVPLLLNCATSYDTFLTASVSQVHFEGTSSCEQFTPHPLKANYCTACYKLMQAHTVESVPDELVIAALEFGAKGERTPSEIIPPDSGLQRGGLYLGGFKAITNEPWLMENNVLHVVNTAKVRAWVHCVDEHPRH